jgi:hypothetical protein
MCLFIVSIRLGLLPLRLRAVFEADDRKESSKLLKHLFSARAAAGLAAVYETTSLDHSLSAMLGHGLEHFLPADSVSLWPQGEDYTIVDNLKQTFRPSICLVADQCKVGGSSIGLLLSRLRATALYDPCHRLWNDCRDGLALAGHDGLQSCLSMLL